VDVRMNRHEQTVRRVWKETIQDEIAALLGDDDEGKSPERTTNSVTPSIGRSPLMEGTSAKNRPEA
jgi:hypothetical protein